MTAASVQSGEIWRFAVRNTAAERVFLVKDYDNGATAWLAMNRTQPGMWEVTTELPPGRYRFRYFTGEGDTVFNGGAFGLHAERIAGTDPRVILEQFASPFAAR